MGANIQINNECTPTGVTPSGEHYENLTIYLLISDIGFAYFCSPSGVTPSGVQKFLLSIMKKVEDGITYLPLYMTPLL